MKWTIATGNQRVAVVTYLCFVTFVFGVCGDNCGVFQNVLHYRIVAFLNRLHQQGTDARPGEHGFGNYRAAEEGAELEADQGDDRQPGVAHGVAPDHRRRAQALGSGGPHVVFAQHLQQAAANHAG